MLFYMDTAEQGIKAPKRNFLFLLSDIIEIRERKQLTMIYWRVCIKLVVFPNKITMMIVVL